MDYPIQVFISKTGEVTMWIKTSHLWHKWMPKTPAPYAKAMAKITKRDESGPTWWGMHEESPEKHGYKFVGVIGEVNAK